MSDEDDVESSRAMPELAGTWAAFKRLNDGRPTRDSAFRSAPRAKKEGGTIIFIFCWLLANHNCSPLRAFKSSFFGH